MIDTFSSTGGGIFAALAVSSAAGLCLGIAGARIWRKSDASVYGDAIQNITEGYYRSSLDGRLLFANKALVQMNGYESEQEHLQSVDDIAVEWYVDPDRRTEFQNLLETDGEVQDFVSEVYRHKTRERIWVSENARMVIDAAGRPVSYEGTVREVTETVRRLELEELHNKLAQHVPGTLFQTRWSPPDKFSIPYFTGGFRKILGDVSELIREDSSFLFKRINPDDYRNFVDSAKESALNMTPWVMEFRVRREDGREIWVELNAMPEREADGSCLWHGFLMDITEKKLSEYKIHSLAFFDPLTELPNRRMLKERVEESKARCGKYGTLSAVLFIDLDNFKNLNDTRGHGMGDELLVQIANRLRLCVGGAGTVARFGGDEFVILLDNLGKDRSAAVKSAEQLAKDVLSSIDEPCALSSGDFHLSCSVGVAMIDGAMEHSFQALKNADTAMYAAKAQGKNQFRLYDSEMQNDVEHSVALMRDLRAALGSDQLSLHFQMQVDKKKQVIGAEAFMRWDHPTLGVISPTKFIPPAEENGFIVELTNWLLEKSIATLGGWNDNPSLAHLRMSINICSQQFHDASFVRRVQALLKRNKIPKGRLVLEVNEGVLAGDLRNVRRVMNALRNAGVRFSLDDFGTGTSSISNLRALPFDEVKIDGGFTTKIGRSKRDDALVSSMINMSDALGIKSVAEWVETDEQHAYLTEAGCKVMQGYLFGTPMPRKAFEAAASLPLVNKKLAGSRKKRKSKKAG